MVVVRVVIVVAVVVVVVARTVTVVVVAVVVVVVAKPVVWIDAHWDITIPVYVAVICIKSFCIVSLVCVAETTVSNCAMVPKDGC